MGEPSKYELDAWKQLQQSEESRRRAGVWLGEKAASVADAAARGTEEFLRRHPRAQSAAGRVGAVAKKGTGALKKAGQKVGDAIPDSVSNWAADASQAVGKTVGDVSRAGLTPKRTVAKHQKHGHPVGRLLDVRDLDLELVDVVRGNRMVSSALYPLIGTGTGIGTSLAITGGQATIVASSGAGAAPGGAVIAGAVSADVLAVVGLVTRTVGQVALTYGYNPNEPSEELFVKAVINAGSAMSTSAKMAAMADISKLTQALYRGAAWKVLDKSVLSTISKEFTKAFGVRLTKQGLGRFVPFAGAAVIGAFNWSTIASVAATADLAYRRRFLLDKYPDLADDEVPMEFSDVNDTEADEVISVVDLLAQEGGPDLRSEQSRP